MTKQVFIRSKNICREKISSMFLCGRTNKKAISIGVIAIIVILIIALVLGIMAAHLKLEKYTSLNATKNGNIMKKYPSSIEPNNGNEFVIPQDAARSGEIAMIVNNLDSAKNSVQNIAMKNGGIVYNTFIAYASDKIKNGSIVIQIPKANFDGTLSDIEKIGSQIVQESSKQIPAINTTVYSQSQSSAESSNSSANVPKEDAATKPTIATDSSTVSTPTVMPMPIYQQITQDKGYIKVVFADYGKKSDDTIETFAKTNVENIFGVGYGGQNMRDNIWVVLAIKSIVLIFLIWIIIIIAKRVITNLQKIRRNKKSVTPIVKQMTKNRKRVIKIAAKVKKK